MEKWFDVSKIWKKIHQQADEGEDEQIKDWIGESPIRQDYYNKISSYFESGSKIRETDINISKAKRKVAFKVFVLPKLKMVFRTAAVFSLILAFSFLINSINWNSWPNNITKEAIKPGMSKATLVLSDGSRYELEQIKNKQFEEQGAVITNTGDSLNYKTLSTINKLKQKKLERSFNTLNIPRGGEFFLSLSDGTKVWLNSETILTYPVQFGKKERQVDLIGEAYFEVAHDSLCPFKVKINGQVIEVLGTSFNINAYPDKASIYTTLVEGGVKINIEGENEDILLKPGYQCQVNKSEGETIVKEVNIRKTVAWKDGNYMFEEETLEEMISTLSRWYNFTYSFENKSARHLKFNGKLKRTEQFQDILTIIENTNEVKFEVQEKQVTIY